MPKLRGRGNPGNLKPRQKGDPRGRPPGSKDRLSSDLRARVVAVWDRLEGDKTTSLYALAHKEPKWFFDTFGRALMPKELTGGLDLGAAFRRLAATLVAEAAGEHRSVGESVPNLVQSESAPIQGQPTPIMPTNTEPITEAKEALH